jgi:hypothetical protein
MHWLHHGVRTGCKSPQTRPVAADAAMATDFRCHKLFRLFEPFRHQANVQVDWGCALGTSPLGRAESHTPDRSTKRDAPSLNLLLECIFYARVRVREYAL